MTRSEPTDPYVVLVEAAIQREMDVMGDGRALDCARSVEGVTIAGDGTGTVQSLDRPGEAVLGDLVEAYTRMSGDVAAFLIARRIENCPESEAVELPSILERHI
jgi:hypothetical protein